MPQRSPNRDLELSGRRGAMLLDSERRFNPRVCLAFAAPSPRRQTNRWASFKMWWRPALRPASTLKRPFFVFRRSASDFATKAISHRRKSTTSAFRPGESCDAYLTTSGTPGTSSAVRVNCRFASELLWWQQPILLLRGDRMILFYVNASSEHELYLKLFITNGGGW